MIFLAQTNCEENTSWKTTNGYGCIDYAINKWCENGGVGSAWQESWKWATDSNGLDARSVCCTCGGSEKSGKAFDNLKILWYTSWCALIKAFTTASK